MKNYISLLTSVLISLPLFADVSPLEIQANKKIEYLQTLIKRAEDKKINTQKERITIDTALLFLPYANWDEKNVEKNTELFSKVTRYKNNAQTIAEELADFERNEIIKMLDTSTAEIKNVLSRKEKRLDTPEIDWSKLEIKNDAVLFEGKPVFLAEWCWAGVPEEHQQRFGPAGSIFLTGTQVIDENGTYNQSILDNINKITSENMGMVFLNHKGIPKWALDKYPEIYDRKDGYTTYDINHPVTKQIMRDTFKAISPLVADKKCSQLGYMLCNEPHWNMTEKYWASGPFSKLAVEDFRKYLKEKHKNISTLNKIWATDYKSFEDMPLPNIMTESQRGTPLYFDFMSYNMYRVTNWFRFLRDEIKKYDPNASTHIKVMVNMWTGTRRDSGIDMEAITFDNDVIGNDAGSCGKWMWGNPHHWEENYSIDWVEMCMGLDFLKSVSPNKIMNNGEAHYISTGKYRNLYEEPIYAKFNYWLSRIHGETISRTWYLSRLPDGKPRDSGGGYAGAANHQPRIVNEIHKTIADLNSVADKIMQIQRLNRPIRIFYTKASAINSAEYMNNIFAQYENLHFEGLQLGFATEDIIKNQDNKQFNSIIVADTPQAYEGDIKALQSYLDSGGTVILDKNSLKTDEYSRPHKISLNQSKGNLIIVDNANQATDKAFEFEKNSIPIIVNDNNSLDQKGCTWRYIEEENGDIILTMSNLSKNETNIELLWNDGSPIKKIAEVLTNKRVKTNNFTLPVYGTAFLRLRK